MPDLKQNDLIEYAKPYLKARGFLKKNKRWTKNIGEFTLCFFIQGSVYSSEDYYVRPGVFINALPKEEVYYGHFVAGLNTVTAEQVMKDFEDFTEKWSDPSYIKKTMREFKKWEERNPLEKRRAGLVDYKADPPPSRTCFTVPESAIKYIEEHF